MSSRMPATPESLFDDARRLRFDAPAEARARVEEAAGLCRAAGDRAGHGRAMAWLGQLDRDSGDAASAAARYDAAAAIARDGDDELLLAHRLRHAGDVRVEAGDRTGAAPLIQEALALYRNADPGPLDLANMLRSAALLRDLQGRLADAGALWAEAAELYAKAGIEAGVAECRGHLG